MADFVQKFECLTDKYVEKASFVIDWKIHKEVINSLFNECDGKRLSDDFQSNFHRSTWCLCVKHIKEKDPDHLELHLHLERLPTFRNKRNWSKLYNYLEK